ncbi:hypothetical protein G7048_25320 (plasmid) [Diaphorobacter sp. HDW4B]|nr:hypothetical protein G7048_25320 [Diaphorobacter sp. HDW4B]
MTTMRWLAQEAPQVPLLIVEQDTQPRLFGELPHPNFQSIFAFNPHGFNRSWGFNVGTRMTQSKVMVFTDADLIVRGQLRPMIDACEHQYPVVKPYESVRDLSETESETLHQGHWDHVPAPRPEALREKLMIPGGMFAIRRDAFFHIGGWDERFVGWGGEDNALAIKLERARIQASVIPGMALHLWHARADAQMDQQLYQNNLALLDSLIQCSEARMARMVEVQRQIMGYQEKYRPTNFAK